VPTEDVARQLGVGLTEYWGCLERCWHAQVGSLETHLECDGGPHGLVAVAGLPTRRRPQSVPSCGARLIEAIKTLGEQERVGISFYFYESPTLRAIGRALDLTEGRPC
jgi:DNA-directed RNA polymerase specialized sigma subunit